MAQLPFLQFTKRPPDNPLFDPSTITNPTESIHEIESLRHKFMDFAIHYGPKLIFGLIVLFIGIWLINRSKNWLKTILIHRGFNVALANYSINLISFVLKLILTISFFSTLGIETTSFVAVLGAASLAVGLALQGNLANFAGGIVLLLFKPFRVGDKILYKEIEGDVREVQIFHTIVVTTDGRKVVLPNGELSNSMIQNLSSEGNRRAELVFYIAPEADIDKARKIIQEIIDSEDIVERDAANLIAPLDINASGVKLVIRLWCKPQNYRFIVNEYPEKIIKAFNANSIPWPKSQMEVKLQQNN